MVGIIFLDFRKAFDTVNLTILKEKLKAVGISELSRCEIEVRDQKLA